MNISIPSHSNRLVKRREKPVGKAYLYVGYEKQGTPIMGRREPQEGMALCKTPKKILRIATKAPTPRIRCCPSTRTRLFENVEPSLSQRRIDDALEPTEVNETVHSCAFSHNNGHFIPRVYVRWNKVALTRWCTFRSTQLQRSTSIRFRNMTYIHQQADSHALPSGFMDVEVMIFNWSRQ